MKYIITRFLESLVTIFIIISVVFLLLRALPPTLYFSEEEIKSMTQEEMNTVLEKEGLLDHPLVQLGRYYVKLAHGDLGTSRRLRQGFTVTSLIGDKFLWSLRFGLLSVVLSYIFGILFGIGMAMNKDRFWDQVGMGYVVVVNAVPALVIDSVICVVGARLLGIPNIFSVDHPYVTGFLPLLCLALPNIAHQMIWIRRYLVDEMNKDYIKLATAKGLSTGRIMATHMLKNAFVPMSQNIPISILNAVGGSMLVERFFSIPGMGALLTDAVGVYDVNVVQALVMLYAILGVMGVFLGDLTLTLFDPRIRLGSKEETR